MRRFSKVLAVAVGLLAFVLGIAPAEASPGRGGTHVVRPGESIQAAIDAAGPGATVVVLPGTYAENILINQDGLKVVAFGATLVAPAHPVANVCADPEHPDAVTGVCVVGDVTPGPNGPMVNRPVKGVSITGLTVKGFGGIGIFVIGGDGTKLIANQTLDDGAYGIFANTSTNTEMLFNRVTGASEAGLYVGDSPDANAKLVGNEASDSQEGVFVRNAQHLQITANRLHDNCAGVVILADAPGPAGDLVARANHVFHNDRACPPSSDGGPPLSGSGFLLAGAHGVDIRGNLILNNQAAVDVPFKGGVVVISVPGGTPPANNTVTSNLILGNSPDLFWDSSGSGNTFAHNLCRTSDPIGLCRG